MPLYLELEPGDSLKIGSSSVRVESKSGGKVRLKVDSDHRVTVDRGDDTPPRPTRPETSEAPAASFPRPKPGT